MQVLSTVWDFLDAQAGRTPFAPVILAPGRRELTYQALRDQVHEAVHALNSFGFGRGDRVAVSLPEGPEWPAALVSVMSGCVCVPLNPGYSVAEFHSSFSNSRVSALVTRSGDVRNAAAAAKESRIPLIELEPLPAGEAGRFRLHGELRSPSRGGFSTSASGFSSHDDLAVIFATSGTTSSPKLIPLTQKAICERARHARHCVDLSSSDRCLDLIPSFQGGAIRVSILGSLFAGASSMYPGAMAPRDFERCIREVKPTWCALPPPYLGILLSENLEQSQCAARYPGLRAFFTTGGPVPAETVDGIERKFGIPLQNYYGAAECGGIAVNPLPPRLRKRGSVGLSTGLELAVLDESCQPLREGRAGEVVVRGSGVFAGYENSDGSGVDTFRGGWYRTGDRGYLDADGYLFLTGRLGNAINRGGEKISPEEVEEILRRHPAVGDAVAFPIPHKTHGQDIAALIVPAPGAPADVNALRDFVSEHLAAFKVPRTILVVDAVPLGPAGKVQRNQLASRFIEEIASSMPPRDGVPGARRANGCREDPPRTSVQRMLSVIWTEILNVDPIGIRERFLDLGGNSLLAVKMLAEVERRFGRSIPMGPFWRSPTVENLAELVVGADHKKCSVMFPVQTSGAKPPLFFVLPGWFVSEAESLSRNLGPDQPVYALIPDPRPGAGQSGRPGAGQSEMTREEIVAECVAAIKTTQDNGSCSVIGRSAAGLVALEIAQKLRSEGKNVALVGLIDSHYPGITIPARLRQIEFLIGEFIALPRSKRAGYLRRLPARACRYTWRRLTGRRLPAQIADAALYTDLHRLFNEVPAPWPGRIIFFAAESSKHRGFLDRRLWWSRVAEQGLEMHLVPGNHDMMVQEPHVRQLAAALKGCLERASQKQV